MSLTSLIASKWQEVGAGIDSVISGISGLGHDAKTTPDANIQNVTAQTPISDSTAAAMATASSPTSNKLMYYAIGGATLLGVLGLILIIKKR